MIDHLDYTAEYDVTLIGAGIMSATLGSLIAQLDPKLKMIMFERLDHAGAESSDAWNNAGTGHAAYCELNYTPMNSDGKIDVAKAKKISHSFEVSKQYWAHLLGENYLKKSASDFIHKIPHLSFVWGEENVSYLEKRMEALKEFIYFDAMQYSTSHDQIKKWCPLVMKSRSATQSIAATKHDLGTDVNFGLLTRSIIDTMQSKYAMPLLLNTEIVDLHQMPDTRWQILYRNTGSKETSSVVSKFVFIGAGGGTLKLLDKSGIPEAQSYGGFPISGQFLQCKNRMIIDQHKAKVYGKASVGAPPMSVPHLDTRYINGRRELLFGPYAGFSTKFLKHGSYMDLPLSVDTDNLASLIGAGWHNIPLTKYLIEQVTQSHEDRMTALREYYPEARSQDWELITAGQRVQVIKSDEEEGGVLEFGTELIHSKDGSLAALLGASPGASSAVSIMLDVIEQCFINNGVRTEWRDIIDQLLPIKSLNTSQAELLRKQIYQSNKALHLL